MQNCKTEAFIQKGSKLEAKNYKAISLLPLVSKKFEKIIHLQTQNFLDVNKILHKFQSGVQQNHSTDTSLSYLNDKILRGFGEGLFTGMILIDLQKAFDTIQFNSINFFNNKSPLGVLHVRFVTLFLASGSTPVPHTPPKRPMQPPTPGHPCEY